MKRTRNLLILFFAILLAGLTCAGGLVIAVDPFFQYHAPLSGVNYVIDNQMNQNPGIAKNYAYDDIIIGSSMTINFDTDLFESLTGEKTVKLSLNASCPKDCSRIMEIVKKHRPDTKRVYWCADIHTFAGGAQAAAYDELPEHLYDDNVLNDLPYLLNKEVILRYILAPHENTAMKDAYIFWNTTVFSREEALKHYALPTEQDAKAADAYLDNIDANLQEHVLPYVEGMPDTEFVFFFPPYSTLYWNTAMAEGNLDAYLTAEEYLIEKLMAYPNVKVYYFRDEYEVITDWNRYSDYYHYDKAVNDYMTECMAGEERRLLPENVAETIETFRTYLQENLPVELE